MKKSILAIIVIAAMFAACSKSDSVSNDNSETKDTSKERYELTDIDKIVGLLNTDSTTIDKFIGNVFYEDINNLGEIDRTYLITDNNSPIVSGGLIFYYTNGIAKKIAFEYSGAKSDVNNTGKYLSDHFLSKSEYEAGSQGYISADGSAHLTKLWTPLQTNPNYGAYYFFFTNIAEITMIIPYSSTGKGTAGLIIENKN